MKREDQNITKVVLKRGKAGPSIGRHPWVFAGAVHEVQGELRDGDQVAVFADESRFIAYGLWNSNSQIRIRLYSWEEHAVLDEGFWRSRIDSALELRSSLFSDEASREGKRLIFSEADRISGLIVDQFNDCLVLQVSSKAIYQRLSLFVDHLAKQVKPRAIYFRGQASVAKAEGEPDLETTLKILHGEEPEGRMTILTDRGVQFELCLEDSQKTGFYLDQRENRFRLQTMSAGARVLDLCCYTGGFAIHAAQGGAREVIGVDSSKSAIEQAKRNAELNEVTKICRFESADVYEFLSYQAEKAEDAYDIVVLDPPRLAPNKASKLRAMRSYYRMNEAALRVVQPGGIFVTCSCSGTVSFEDMKRLLQSVGGRSRRDIQILEQTGAAPDHPILAACPETEYLKCIVCRVI